MKKLTKQEANDLIQKAWQDVPTYTLGSYRFGQALWQHLDKSLIDQYVIIEDSLFYGYNKDVDFFYETDYNVVSEKFFKYFVED